MVQSCCTKCMGGVGRFLSYLFLCKCCCGCCCCCTKKQNNEEIKQESNLEQISKEQVCEADDGEVYEEYVEDDISIYNGSSTYGGLPASVDKQMSSTTSGIYTSESSLHTSGSSFASSSPNGRKEIYENRIMRKNKPEVPEKRSNSVLQRNQTEIRGSISNIHGQQNQVKLELSCEIKGAMEIGGKQQPVKGILLIVPDELQQRTTSAIHLRHNKSRTETFPKQEGQYIYNKAKAPRPLPRTHSNEGNINEAFQTRMSEMYLHRNSALVGGDREIPANACYDTPKPPLPSKSRRLKDFATSGDSIYENVRVKTNSRKEETPRRPDLKLPRNNFHASSRAAEVNEDIYEYIDPQDRYEYGNERVDSEIYMSHA